jgi:hypothetical protein
VSRLLALCAIAGCVTQGNGGTKTVTPPPPPPPVVTDLSPATGGYGTTVTITGTGFSTTGNLAFEGLPDELDYRAVVSWSDTQIIARVPFPATAGPIHVTNSFGMSDTPVFTPDSPWTAGTAATTTAVVAAQRFGTTTDVLGLDINMHVQLLSFGATTQTYMLDGITGSTDERTPTLAMLAGVDEVLGNDAAHHLIDFTVADGAIVATDTGLVGELIAADPSGAWLQTYDTTSAAYQLSHAKPGTPWTIDRGPIATLGVIAGQLATDGTLVVAWSHPDGGIFDNMANVAVAHLAPGATVLSPTEYPEDTAWDDYIASIQLQISPDGQRMLLAYSSQEFDKDFDVPHPALARTSAGNWTAAQGLESSGAPLVFTASSMAAFVEGGDDIAIVPDIAAPATTVPVPVWPALPDALVSAGTTLLPVVGVGNHLWVPTPPAMPPQ